MDDVVVARIGKPHGLKGEVTVQVHTDSPGERFVTGAVFATEPAAAGPLTLRSARWHNGIQLLAFEQALDRTSAEALRGTRLLSSADAETEDDAWYEDDLVGLAVVAPDGTALGSVVALHPRPVQDLLEIEKTGGGTAYVPFVEEIVPEVDVDAGRVVVDAPPGLLDLDG
ncbi:ribosome maturation factor RimM [Luteipulveratus sp. YIM 133132]|uniref:ribosome maturation factor RimM n=1 Tax=Luteipulveratus flavus TaxID=3031728 RepID=UPI0023B16F9B|nr:ribosome maturation factor RimM [Luteipulveratus sp. YIM 133132]MDE9367892.1 ribosome maturation factor RimM [Luteipulveratus sp. YIM 133132]